MPSRWTAALNSILSRINLDGNSTGNRMASRAAEPSRPAVILRANLPPAGQSNPRLDRAGLDESLFLGIDESLIPPAFVCPLTQSVMRNPVIDIEGNSWELEAIEQWLSRNAISPLTRSPLRMSDLATNRALRNAIEELCKNLKDGNTNPLFSNSIPEPESGEPWIDCEECKDRTFRIVASKLGLTTLNQKQKLQIEMAFQNVRVPDESSWSPEINSAFQVKAAIARCRWLEDSNFRMRVYGEFAQWLHPNVPFQNLGKLAAIVKEDAERFFLNTYSRPYLTNDIDRIREGIIDFSRLYNRGPSGDDYRIQREQEQRWSQMTYGARQ